MVFFPCAARLAALCALPLACGNRMSTQTEELGLDTSESGKAFLSVMTWNVEKLDGKSASKTKYVNKVVEKVVGMHKVDVILLQEAQSCSLVKDAMQATGMACVESVVKPSHEEKMSFTVLGGLILYSKTAFRPAAGTANRATDFKEWSQWIDTNEQAVLDKHSKTLKAKWQQSCTWSKYNGCKSIHADIPQTNSIKLYLKAGQFSTALHKAFASGIRPMNIHLFSGGKNRAVTDKAKMDRRTFQMRSLIWMNKIWNYNDKYDDGEPAPTTIYAGDFNTRRKEEIDKVLAPSGDYNLIPWKASDSLRTHVNGEFLDHVVLSSKPGSAIIRASTETYEQFGCKTCANSDHNPLVVKLYASTSNATAA